MTRHLKISVELVDGDNVTSVVTQTVPLPPEDYDMGKNDPVDLIQRFITLYQMLICKDFSYRGSWMKRGKLRGIFPNIDRKDDRWNSAMENEYNGIGSERDLCDAGVDGGMYRLLFVLVYLRTNNAPVFLDWWKNEVTDFIDRTVPLILELQERGPLEKLV